MPYQGPANYVSTIYQLCIIQEPSSVITEEGTDYVGLKHGLYLYLLHHKNRGICFH